MERSYTITSGKTEERATFWRGCEGGDNVDPSVADREMGERLSVEFAVGEERGEEGEEGGLGGGGGGGGRSRESAQRRDWILITHCNHHNHNHQTAPNERQVEPDNSLKSLKV